MSLSRLIILAILCLFSVLNEMNCIYYYKRKNYFMKQVNGILRHILLVCLAFSFTFCGDNDNDDFEPPVSGLIPGLGNVQGDLTGTPFVLPAGISLNGSILGSYDVYTNPIIVASEGGESFYPQKKSDVVVEVEVMVDTVLGSGYNVVLYIPLKNTTASPIEVVLPAGLIIVAGSSDFQDGVLLKKVSFEVPANKTYGIILLTYSGNERKSTSLPSITYKWGVVSNVPVLTDLCDRLANKKINYEEFERASEIYNIQSKELQNILWAITDDVGAYKNQLEWVDNLPQSVK